MTIASNIQSLDSSRLAFFLNLIRSLIKQNIFQMHLVTYLIPVTIFVFILIDVLWVSVIYNFNFKVVSLLDKFFFWVNF